MKKKYKYIYGPVYSWRIGRSLGIDMISQKEKVCTYDCVYCQIGRGGVPGNKRKKFVSVKKIMEEIGSLPSSVKIDYFTFSGKGEPTLAGNLREAIAGIRKIRREKIAVITNSSLIHRKDVQKDLCRADMVVMKLDAPSKEVFADVNCPVPDVEFDKMLKGIREFRSIYKGKLSLQMMFVKGNKDHAAEMARLAADIGADEVQINTPLRPSGERPLTRKEMDGIKKYFKSMNIIYVYGAKKKKVEPISEKDTLARRGKI
jgi:wyosine [tRNA(Phe)-imidazoG37] synthetase (radical SAM superfamily)